MNPSSPLIGILASAGVLAALVAPRLMGHAPAAPQVFELRDVEIAVEEDLPPPPPPPPADESAPPPPPMALTGLSDIPDPSLVALPSVNIPIPVNLPVEAFQLNSPPSVMPSTNFNLSGPRGPATNRNAGIGPVRPGPPAPVAKSSYRVAELDGSPRLIHHPSVSFPTGLASQGVRAGTVTLEVELNESGRVTVRRVLSSTHPELISPARYVAQGSRYTPPKRNGMAVKAIMRWPITITQ